MFVYNDIAGVIQHMIMILFVVVADHQFVKPRCNTYRGRNVFLCWAVKERRTFVYGATYVRRTQSGLAVQKDFNVQGESFRTCCE